MLEPSLQIGFIIFLSFITRLIHGAALPSTSSVFTFAKQQAFLRIEPDWPLPSPRQVTFKFRTEKSHGLLMYHGVVSTPESAAYEMLLMLENGRIKLIHVFREHVNRENVFIGKGLNRDKWHHVQLQIQPDAGELMVRVDQEEITVTLPSLKEHPRYNIEGAPPQSFLYFGGMDAPNAIKHQEHTYFPFVGCLGDIRFNHSESDPLPAVIHNSDHLKEGCIDLCDIKDPCLNKGRCVNHYTHLSCDCFGTNNEDYLCGRSNLTSVILRGYSYITYRVYDWRDRAHSDANRISVLFRTFVADSVLLYGGGEHPLNNYIAISILGGSLYVEIDFGDGPINATLGTTLHDESWHNFTMVHHGKRVVLTLDNRLNVTLTAVGLHHHLHLDPDLSIGGVSAPAKGLLTTLKFVGCLKSLYFNQKNVLNSLHRGDPAVQHHGIFPVELGCRAVSIIPLTFPFSNSKLLLYQPSTKRLHLTIEFKTMQSEAVLGYGVIKTETGKGFWELWIRKGTALFTIVSDEAQPQKSWHISEGKHLTDGQWHQVDVSYDGGDVQLEVDFRNRVIGTYAPPLEFFGQLIIGDSGRETERGFVGCMRDLAVSGEWVDPRMVVGTEHARGKVSLDNCQLLNLCNNPRACEHGGRCFIENQEVHCDCSGTGYTGKTCHFSTYKRTCQELYLVGYRESGVYKIDIDRNGPLPPAHVYCDMQGHAGEIITRVDNNMPLEMVVRKKGMSDFVVDVHYREFTPAMLQSLIHHSKQCTQHVKYDCTRTPLGLRTYTWMQSSHNGHYVYAIGTHRSGHCQCGITHTCANALQVCNCDIQDDHWRVDEGDFTHPRELGITRVYMVQPSSMDSTSEARFTLGPLKCVEANTQAYIITFKTTQSYLEVPGWRTGDMAFSFRTSSSRAVLVYQTALHATHGYFRVALTSDYELSFDFTVNGKPRNVKLPSGRKLNSGEWQQVWVDHDTNHMRFTVNLDSVMIDLDEEEEIGPFEGPMYVGGVPRHHKSEFEFREGFIGCFRGLVIGEEVVDIYTYLTSRPDIVKGCRPSCLSNPCKNGATCHEFWGSYECECANPLAHSGPNCEHNLNENSMTFLTPNSYHHNVTEGGTISPILEEDLLLSFRTFEEQGLLLYAFDHLNNFVQLHLEKVKGVVFTFNSLRSIVQGSVYLPEIVRGEPVQVKVDREKDQTILIVNDKVAIIRKPIKFLEKYDQKPWREGEDYELVKPSRGVVVTVDHSEVLLGGVDGVGTSSQIPGFVGCLQGLTIGGKRYDLDAATKQHHSPDGQVLVGCKMLCDLKPCHNGGFCIEDFKSNHTSCDCSLTSYRGEACQRDAGSSFDGRSLLYHPFKLDAAGSDTVRVQFAFSTGVKSSSNQAMVFVQFAKSTKYILVALTPEGSLLIEEDQGSTRLVTRSVTKKGGGFADGHRHWILYKRTDSNTELLVDGQENPVVYRNVDRGTGMSDSAMNNVVIGGTHSADPRFTDYGSFQGCISNIVLGLSEQTILPLDTLFGYHKGHLETVKVEGTISEVKCADFAVPVATALSPPIVPPEIKGPEWDPEEPLKVPYKNPFPDPRAARLTASHAETARVAAVAGVLLAVVLIAVVVYTWRLQQRHKNYQFREDTPFFQGKRRSTSPKVVSFGDSYDEPRSKYPDSIGEAQPLKQLTILEEEDEEEAALVDHPESFPEDHLNDISHEEPDAIELVPLRPTTSQELEWDPAADNADLITAAMNEMNTEEPDDASQENLNEDRRDGIPKHLTIAPLASVSENGAKFKVDANTGSVVFVGNPYE